MSWTAIVPLKRPGEGKSRLAEILDEDQRAVLVLELLDICAQALASEPNIERIVLVSPNPIETWSHEWRLDKGRGLNQELAAAAEEIGGCILIVHPDLPLLETSDVSHLIEAASSVGVAIAPDMDGTGTNALAMSDGHHVRPQFGPNSFGLHATSALEMPVVVRREGLSLDCDRPDQLHLAISRGFETNLPTGL